MERVSGAPYHPLTRSKIETNVRTWVHSRRAPEAALTVSYSQKEKSVLPEEVEQWSPFALPSLATRASHLGNPCHDQILDHDAAQGVGTRPRRLHHVGKWLDRGCISLAS